MLMQFSIACALIISALSVPASVDSWRGITPLLSTRADVERLLGTPAAGQGNVYTSGNETVLVTYAAGQCAYGWQVQPDTVISFIIQPTQGPRFADLKLDESNFEKRRDVDGQPIYYYVNQTKGINYTVKEGVITSMEYYPSAKDNHLRCPTLSVATGQPADYLSPAPGKATVKMSPPPPAKIYQCPMHPKVTSRKPGFCRLCGMRLVARRITPRRKKTPTPRSVGANPSPATNRIAQILPAEESWATLTPAERLRETEKLSPTYEYTCPMHPEIHMAEAGVCPRCGMLLVPTKPSVGGDYKLSVTTSPLHPRPGEKVLLRFSIQHPETSVPVTRYVVNHEKLFHLFIVSQDLKDYQHIHPQLNDDGTFTVATVFPRQGVYRLHADFFPVGGTPQVIHQEVATQGSIRGATPVLKPDALLTKTVDGMNITLDLEGVNLIPGNLFALNYRLTDAVTGEPVRDLEPYLGAWGHTLILNADQSEYLHCHPSKILPVVGDRARLRGGPEVEFKTIFPSRGPYRIWTQFQRGGKVTTVSFTLNVI